MTASALIGSTTEYLGDEIPGLKGRNVRVFAVLRCALRANVDADGYYVTDNELLSRLGGVTADDRIELAKVKQTDGASFVRCYARAVDLECLRSIGAER